MNITSGRQALAALIGAVTGITYSPAALPELVNVKQLPAAVVRFRNLTHDVIGTGGVYQAGYNYRVQVVVSLLKVETAEATLESAFDGILAALRTDPTVGGVCEDMRVRIVSEPDIVPEENSATPLLVGALDVTLAVEER